MDVLLLQKLHKLFLNIYSHKQNIETGGFEKQCYLRKLLSLFFITVETLSYFFWQKEEDRLFILNPPEY